MEVAVEKGWDIPEDDRPQVSQRIAVYYQAFMDCSTCRQVGFGVGPIPWNTVMIWAKRKLFDYEETEHLWSVISRADMEWLERVNAKNASKQK